jgi:hypothetical protein
MAGRRMFVVKTCLGLSSLLLFLGSGAAPVPAESQSASPTSNLQRLVSETIQNEEGASKTLRPCYEYEEVDWSPGETSISEEIETPEGVFGRLLEVNGHPPSAKRSRKEKQQLEKLARDPAARRSMARGEQEDVDRRMALLKEFPGAFWFERDGPEKRGVVPLKFEPNPYYKPSSRDAIALKGMEGTLWIDAAAKRLVKIDGTLIRDVTLGWGVVVRLRRGGRFSMEQAQVSPGVWKLTLLSADVHGKIFLVKNLNLQMKEIHQSFKRVRDDLSAAEAVSMLLEPETRSHISVK